MGRKRLSTTVESVQGEPHVTEMIQLSLVRCDPANDSNSQMTQLAIARSVLDERLISTTEQQVAANEAKSLHLAAAHPDHGRVTYLQEVTEGGFFVYVGNPSSLQEHWFGPGSWVAFTDDHGTGHASKVGPHGCKRNFRMLRGHLEADN